MTRRVSGVRFNKVACQVGDMMEGTHSQSHMLRRCTTAPKTRGECQMRNRAINSSHVRGWSCATHNPNAHKDEENEEERMEAVVVVGLVVEEGERREGGGGGGWMVK
jgi:hypothetical protein